jgi:hypothetical protein
MKKIKLFTTDYIFIVCAFIFLIAMFMEEGFASIKVIATISVIGLVVYFLGRYIFRLVKSAEHDGRLVKWFDWIKSNVVVAVWIVVPIYFAFIALWFCFKVFFSFLMWLKHGYWAFYDYQPACLVLEFSCYPNTGLVKINELLAWIYGFDVTVFLFVTALLVVFVLFLLREPIDSK